MYDLRMEKPRYPSDEADKFMLRLADGLRERLADEAKKNGRSINSEINARLQASFDPAPAASPPEAIERMTDTLAQLTLEFDRLRRQLDEPEPVKKAPAKTRSR